MLNIQIVTLNNDKTIKHTLESIKSIAGSVTVYDLGSTDQTLSICSSYKVKTIKGIFIDNISNIKNDLIEQNKKNWNFFIEPWEVLVSGGEDIKALVSNNPSAYKVQIIQNEVIGKETRLWHKTSNLKFENPIFEFVSCPDAKVSNIVLYNIGQSSLFDNEKQLEILKKWKIEQPLSAEPIYYEAFLHLANSNYNEFLACAESYLFKSSGMAATMLRFYYANIQLKVFDNLPKSSSAIAQCIIDNPKMAEFWCLLGDIYFRLTKFSKAIEFYNTGIILGSQRKLNDEWTINVKKYKDYPLAMIARCNDFLV